MPKSDGSHYVDAILTYEGDEVATVTGTYKSEGAGDLDAEAIRSFFRLIQQIFCLSVAVLLTESRRSLSPDRIPSPLVSVQRFLLRKTEMWVKS